MSDLLAPNPDPAKEVEQMKALMKMVLEHSGNKIMDMHRFALEVKVYGFDEAMKRVTG